MGVREQQYVVMAVGGERYGAPVEQVLSIEKRMEVTRVPKTLAFIKGIMNLRGAVVPVIDLAERIGLTSGASGEDSRIVVVALEGMLVGMTVDAVTDVVTLDESMVEPAPSIVGGLRAEYLKGVAKLDDRFLILLNLSRLLSDVEERQLRAVEKSLRG